MILRGSTLRRHASGDVARAAYFYRVIKLEGCTSGGVFRMVYSGILRVVTSGGKLRKEITAASGEHEWLAFRPNRKYSDSRY